MPTGPPEEGHPSLTPDVSVPVGQSTQVGPVRTPCVDPRPPDPPDPSSGTLPWCNPRWCPVYPGPSRPDHPFPPGPVHSPTESRSALVGACAPRGWTEEVRIPVDVLGPSLLHRVPEDRNRTLIPTPRRSYRVQSPTSPGRPVEEGMKGTPKCLVASGRPKSVGPSLTSTV